MNNNISNDELLYKQKYLKYKSKYTDLKQQEGGLFGKETTILFYNKFAFPDIVKAINKYKKIIQQNDISMVVENNAKDPNAKDPKSKEPKYNQVSISNNDINGIPCMWKYTVGKGKLEPIFNIFMEFAGSSQKDKKTIDEQKKYKTTLDSARKDYIAASTLDFQKEKVSGDISWDKYLNSVNCDNLKIKGTKLLNHINEALCGDTALSNKRKEAYNKFIELYQHALSTKNPESDKTLRPIAITDKLGFSIENGNVKEWNIIDDFILVENFKQSGSSMLGLSSEQVLTFKINSISDTIEPDPSHKDEIMPVDTRNNNKTNNVTNNVTNNATNNATLGLPDALSATPTSPTSPTQ
jgi:hypothetical protein